MPRNPAGPRYTKIYPHATRGTIHHIIFPLSAYSQCESAAYVRQAIRHAIDKDLNPVAEGVDLLPTARLIALPTGLQRSRDGLEAIESEERVNHAAIGAASHLRNARVFYQQAEEVTEEIRPILYYYGGLSFLDFITSAIVRRRRIGKAGHGLSVLCDSEGWDFDKRWAREQCFVEMGSSGDFPFYVDALTVGGWPSYFSGFRLHKDTKRGPWEVKENPAPLLKKEKMSLDLLCNFDRERYLNDDPGMQEWLKGTDSERVWKMTTLLLDFVVVFVASSLARYYIPAWQGIVGAVKTHIYNDIRTAFSGVAEGLPYYFEDEHPFQYSFGTRIGP